MRLPHPETQINARCGSSGSWYLRPKGRWSQDVVQSSFASDIFLCFDRLPGHLELHFKIVHYLEGTVLSMRP